MDQSDDGNDEVEGEERERVRGGGGSGRMIARVDMKGNPPPFPFLLPKLFVKQTKKTYPRRFSTQKQCVIGCASWKKRIFTPPS